MEEIKTRKNLFKKGTSGNPKGRPKGSVSIVSAIKRKIQKYPKGHRRSYLELIVDKYLHKALIDGDTAVIKDIIDRVDGKAKQSIDLDPNERGGFNITIREYEEKNKSTNKNQYVRGRKKKKLGEKKGIALEKDDRTKGR